jgi:O-antigen/teichoic acid export membrane protein
MLKKIKELASDSMYYGLTSVISQIISLFLVPFYTNELNPEDYGVLNMIGLLAAFILPIAGLGMDGALFRYYSLTDDSEKKKAYFSAAVIIKTISTVIFVLLFLPIYPYLNKFLFNGYLTITHFYLFLLYFLLDNFAVLSAIILRSERKVKRIAFINVSSIVVGLAFSLFLVIYLKWKVTGALIAMLTTSIYKIILYSNVSNKNFIFSKPESHISNDLFKYGLPVIPHKIQGNIISMFTAFMINQKLGIAAAGLYAVASKLAKPIAFIVNIVQQSWVPFKFQIHKTDTNPPKTFRDITSLYLLLIVSIWAMLSILTPTLFYWLLNKKYWSGMAYTPFIMFVSVCQGFAYMILTGFELSDRQNISYKATFVGMVFMIVSSLLTINFYPPYSFIIAQSLSFAIIIPIFWPEIRKQIKIDYPFKHYLLFFISSVINIILFYSINTNTTGIIIHLIIQIIISTLAFRLLFRSYSLSFLLKSYKKRNSN